MNTSTDRGPAPPSPRPEGTAWRPAPTSSSSGSAPSLAIAGALGFLVWLAQFEVNRQFNYYDVIFDNVSGLSRASDVRFNGLTVGQVVSIGLSERHVGKVSARIEVTAGTPINEDTTAQLASQGVTGVSYVSLTSGRDDAAPLKGEDGQLPEIFAKRSVVEALQHDAPDLVAQAKGLVEDVRKVFTPELAGQVNQIVGNLDKATQDLGGAFDDFAKIANSVQLAAGQVGNFTGRLDPIGDAVQTSLGNLDTRAHRRQGRLRRGAEDARRRRRHARQRPQGDRQRRRGAAGEAAGDHGRPLGDDRDAPDRGRRDQQRREPRRDPGRRRHRRRDRAAERAQGHDRRPRPDARRGPDRARLGLARPRTASARWSAARAPGSSPTPASTLAEVKPSIEALNRIMTEDVPGIVDPGARSRRLGQPGDRRHRQAYRRAGATGARSP